MAERIQHYMSLNPKPTPPIEVSSYTYSYIYLVLSLEIKPVAAMLNSMFIFQASRCAQWSCEKSRKMCLRLTGHKKVWGHMWIRRRGAQFGRSQEAWGDIPRGRESLRLDGFRECGTPACVSAIISVYISLFWDLFYNLLCIPYWKFMGKLEY